MTTLRQMLHRLGLTVTAVALIALATTAIAWAQDTGQGSTDDPELLALGNDLFQANCATCHGPQGRGLDLEGPSGGPSLLGVGAASVDFMLRTGRMPLSDQRDPLTRSSAAFDTTQRLAIVAHVANLTPGQGPMIPDISDHTESDLARGLEIFTTNCAACHGPTGAGVAVGQQDVSSNLEVTAPIEIAEAVRTGPGVMPLFGPEAIDDADLKSLVRWVDELPSRQTPGGLSVGRSGPVSEGAVAWIVGLGLLGIAMYLLGDKTGDTGHGQDGSDDA